VLRWFGNHPILKVPGITLNSTFHSLAPGDFTQALKGRIGPFLLPSAASGGAEMPPVTAANPTPDTDPAHFGGVFAPTPYP
jgi:hypothetical protein